MTAIEDRLWPRLVHQDNGCWDWPGGRMLRGYGVIWYNGHSQGTHRVAWELTNGPIPDGLFVLHSCDNPPCCNPAHLFVGTHAENIHDMDAKGRRINAPLRGTARRNAKLTEEAVRAIRARVAAGESQRSMAKLYGVSGTTARNVALGRDWPHVR